MASQNSPHPNMAPKSSTISWPIATSPNVLKLLGMNPWPPHSEQSPWDLHGYCYSPMLQFKHPTPTTCASAGPVYIHEKHKHLVHHSWFKEVKALNKSMTQGRPDHTLAEALFEQLITASIYAGSKLKRFPPAPYSPTIACLRNIHQLLKLAVMQGKTSKDLMESILRTKAKLGNARYELPIMLETCIKALLSCTRQLKAATRDEIEMQNLRRNHQDKLIEQYEATGNTKMAKRICGMKHAEQTKVVFRGCKAAQNLGSDSGLTHVMVPVDPNENPKTCNTGQIKIQPIRLA